MSTNQGDKIVAPAADLPGWAEGSLNLAGSKLGAKILKVSDDFFASADRMLQPEPAVFYPDLYDSNGKYMDGWESRRKRKPGFDWCIVELGCKGKIRGFDFDTSHFTGNYAPAISLFSICSENAPDENSDWEEIVAPEALNGNTHNFFRLDEKFQDKVFSHLKVCIHPDGGLARLRVFGDAVPSADLGDTVIDLAAIHNGSMAIAHSDAHFGEPLNMLFPGRGVNMGDGWETRRRREPGFDWCIIRLAGTGTITGIEVDTAHFKGNFPKYCSVNGGLTNIHKKNSLVSQSIHWEDLLPMQPLQPDQIINFDRQIQPIGKINYIRFNIYPDGGVSRIRVFGKIE